MDVASQALLRADLTLVPGLRTLLMPHQTLNADLLLLLVALPSCLLFPLLLAFLFVCALRFF